MHGIQYNKPNHIYTHLLQDEASQQKLLCSLFQIDICTLFSLHFVTLPVPCIQLL